MHCILNIIHCVESYSLQNLQSFIIKERIAGSHGFTEIPMIRNIICIIIIFKITCIIPF